MYVTSLTEIIKLLEVFAPFFFGPVIKQEKHDAILQRRRKLLWAVDDEISFTDITSRISTKDLEHPFVIFDSFPPLTKYLHQVIQYGCWEDDIAGEDSPTLWVKSEDKFSADAEI
jgi:hypothetical protein